ncbi:MAG: hypothetical protein HPY75_06880 [Actinobacteria bacterium]|nr:hypothetical protein [Actinomycetota bacterium]
MGGSNPDRVEDGAGQAAAAIRAKLRADLVALRRAVRECGRCAGKGGGIPGRGEPGASLFMLAGMPGPGAVSSNPWGSWWEGVSSRAREEWGWDLRSVYLSTALRCPAGRPNRKDVQRCSAYLAEELRIVGPRLVLVSGKVAAVALREALGGEVPANPKAGDSFRLLNATFLFNLDVARIAEDAGAERVFFRVLKEAEGFLG